MYSLPHPGRARAIALRSRLHDNIISEDGKRTHMWRPFCMHDIRSSSVPPMDECEHIGACVGSDDRAEHRDADGQLRVFFQQHVT